jgi:hypothetical protein
VEHVPYATGDEFWVRFNQPFDMTKLGDITKKHDAVIVKFGRLPSKLPRALGELLWDGISFVITKKIGGWASFTASLGFEPDGIAKIATDAHGPYQIYIATKEEGVQILYDYLGLKYVAPVPPPKPIAPKPQAPPQAKPAQPTPTPAAAPVPSGVTSPQTIQAARPAPPVQPSPAPAQATPKGQYRAHAWGQKVGGSEQASTQAKSSEEKTE